MTLLHVAKATSLACPTLSPTLPALSRRRHASSLALLLLSILAAACSDAGTSTAGDPAPGTGAVDADGNLIAGTGGTPGDTALNGTGGGDAASGGGDTAPGVTVLPGEVLVEVSDVASLRAALVAAEPGHHIVVAPGVYAAPDTSAHEYATMTRNAYFYSHSAGLEGAPITIESADPNDPAQLVGLGSSDSSYLLWIKGENWEIRNLVLTSGGKGLMLDEASGSHVDGIEVRDMGDEAIHLRSGTSNVVVENFVVDGTGSFQPGFGEGVYIGSDNGQWDKYEKACNNNVIQDCTILGTTAEGVDIKEGTTGNIVQRCKIYGGSISGENYADSFVDLKGDGAQVLDNEFYKEGNAVVTRGVAIVDREVELTATNNWIYDNTYDMTDATGYMVYAYRGTGNHAWNNVRTPAGEEYKGNDPELAFTDPR